MKLITPDWPAPEKIRAFTTTRSVWGENISGVNAATQSDRDSLVSLLSLPASPIWPQQTHSNIAVTADSSHHAAEADAVFTAQPEQVCMVLTADCLPVLLCSTDGAMAAAIHAGWRGLAKGVIENTVNTMQTDPANLLAWLGPAIGPHQFEVGADVYQAFTAHNPQCASCFISHQPDKWMANLYQLASLRLQQLGITNIYGGEYCTHTQKDLFFSFRRDQKKTGRMASVIWIDR